MNEIIITITICLIPFLLNILFVFFKTKGTMYSEKIVYNEHAQPDHIICTHHNIFNFDRISIKRHPNAEIKMIERVANDPFYKYIGSQIRENGSWSESDGIPEEIKRESKEYRKKH